MSAPEHRGETVQTWRLHRDPYGVMVVCWSSLRGTSDWCERNGYTDHIEVVPAAALAAERERADRWEKEAKQLACVRDLYYDDARQRERERDAAEQRAEEAQKEVERLREAIATMDRILPLGDLVYDVRQKEGKGWYGPLLTEWNAAYMVIQGAALRDGTK